jgi:Uma2 family endonuclease
MVPSPSFEHQQVSAAIFRQLDESLDDCPHCQAVFEIDVEFAQDTVVRPDVLVICYQPEGERLTRTPDLIFEVISPRTTRRDEVDKFDLYRTEGVTHYVLVYPEAKKATVWRLEEGEYRKVGDFHDKTIVSNCPNAPSISISAACGSARAVKREHSPACTCCPRLALKPYGVSAPY